MANQVKAQPDGYHSVTPYLSVRGATRAIEFYQKAFGATEILRMPMPDGTIAHAELRIGDSVVMLADESPEGCPSPESLKGTTARLMVYVPDVDATFHQAIAAGAKELTAPADQFYGDRNGRLRDPFGHEWMLSTHIEDVSPEEMDRRMQALFAGPGCNE